MKKFYMVWNENMSMPKVKHPTFEHARAEAERIARRHPNDPIHVIVSVGTFRKRDVDYEEHE